MNPINNMQKTLVHIALSDLGIDDNGYRLLLINMFPDVNWSGKKPSCVDLNQFQADELIKEFKTRGFEVKSTGGSARRPKWNNSMRRPKAPNIVDLASPQILNMINRLSMDIRWRVRDGFFPWMKSKFGITHIKTMAEAIKVLEGLKAMKRWQQKQGTPVGPVPETVNAPTPQGEPF